MKRVIGKMFACFFIALAASNCSSLKTRDNTEVTLYPRETHEECLDLTPLQVLSYSFEASGPVNFNIHYHEREAIDYVVSREDVSSGRDDFRPSKEQFYCLMWTNPQIEQVRLSYKFKVTGNK